MKTNLPKKNYHVLIHSDDNQNGVITTIFHLYRFRAEELGIIFSTELQ
jgi:hypothetical protein